MFHFLHCRWTGEMLGDIMLLCLRCERFSQALDVLTKLEEDQNSIVGVPNIEALQLFTDICISQNKITEALVSFNIIILLIIVHVC
jgi:hypothetical protein